MIDSGISENIDYIRKILKVIVDKEHSNPEKKEVREKSGGGFQIACPYCGDSEKNPKKYRGNFNSLLWYKCFNDGCEKQSHFTSMCKDFGVKIDGGVKKNLYEYLDYNTSKVDTFQEELSQSGFNNLIDLDDFVTKINNNEYQSSLFNIKQIQKNSLQYHYLLNNRGLTPKYWTNIYQADWMITKTWNEKVILYLNRKGNNLIGMQLRNLKDGYKRKFHVYTFEELNNISRGPQLSDGQIMMYNKLSYLYGILQLDFSRPITIFEGYGDALLWPNSIGLSGVNIDASFLENNSLDIRYLYDNDKAGHYKSEVKIKEGTPVFLWNKFFDEIVKEKKMKDPYYHFHKISKIKDLTNLNKIIPSPYKKLHMEEFFSKDLFDLKYIPKTTYKKKFKYKKQYQ